MINLKIHFGGRMEKVGEEDYVYEEELGVKTVFWELYDISWAKVLQFSREDAKIIAPIRFIWYKEAGKEMKTVNYLFEDNPNDIFLLICLGKQVSELELFIEYDISEQSEPAIRMGGSQGEEYSESDEEVDRPREEEEAEKSEDELQENVDEEAEEPVVNENEPAQADIGADVVEDAGDGSKDERFMSVFDEGSMAKPDKEAYKNFEEKETADREAAESDEECVLEEEADYPDTPIGSDEEWEQWDNPKGSRNGKSKFYGDLEKEPYIWLFQKFNSGLEFKDQLLRYSLKTQYDVKMAKSESNRIAVVCCGEKCKFRVYCSFEPPINKWMVKVMRRVSRSKPVINLLEDIRRQAMRRVSRRFLKAEKCDTVVTPITMAVLEKARVAKQYCSTLRNSKSVYEVNEFECGYTVNLSTHQCACRKWDLTGIPCKHAVCVLDDNEDDPVRYVADYYYTDVLKKTYEDNIKPVNGEKFWKKTNKPSIAIPEFRKPRGRPKNRDRRKEPFEDLQNLGKSTRHGRIQQCSRCKQAGHIKSGCRNEPVTEEGPKNRRGRPRKHPVEEHNKPPPKPRGKRKTPSLGSSSQPVPSNAIGEVDVTSSAPQPSSSTNQVKPHVKKAPRGRPLKIKKTVNIPHGVGAFWSPYTDRPFEVFGNRIYDRSNLNPLPQEGQSNQPHEGQSNQPPTND